jgi:HD superfamily phosphodiesterase
LEQGLEIWIGRAEASWLDELYANAESLYRNTSLPSHDHTHHLRVWNLCKKLLREIAPFSSPIDQLLVEGVLIAAFFHDLGMVYSTRPDHGHLGAELCMEWFMDGGRERPGNFKEILRAIELHDRKDEQIHGTFQRETPPEILTILSVADDLEALGIIGIYRYAEIYLRRGIPLEDLGDRILANASARFHNISRACLPCKHMIENFRPQYEELSHFFENYNKQLRSVSRADGLRSGPLGVINYIRTGGRDLSDLVRTNGEVHEFFRKLEHELEQARL